MNGFTIPEIQPFPNDFDPKSFEGRKVAIKYGNCSQGSWHIGIISWNSNIDAQWNCSLHFVYTDKSLVNALLSSTSSIHGKVHPQQRHPKFSWLLLESFADFQRKTITPENVKNPSSSNECGRPSSRKAPAFGPTSKNHPKPKKRKGSS